MDPNMLEAVRETLRLTRENNAILHKMRRGAFIAGFFKLLIYAILFAAPIWFYMTYISSSVDQLLAAANKIQGTTSAAQDKFSGFEDAIKNIQSHLPAFMQPATTTNSTAQ